MIEGACHCGQVHWRYGLKPKGATACNCTVCRRWGAVNVRLAEPEAVAAIPIDHFDGLNGSRTLPRDGKCVADYWF